jgi:hypothetical protein
VEEIEEPTMREIRYLDKLIDELTRGKKWIRFCGASDQGEGGAPSRDPANPAADGLAPAVLASD